MKTIIFKLLAALALVLGISLNMATPALAAVTITPATGGSAIAASTAVSGSYTTLTGPIITEGHYQDIGTGTIVLNAPNGFQFKTDDTAGNRPKLIVSSGSSNSDNNINNTSVGSSIGTVTVTSSTISVNITNRSANNYSNTLTWQNIRVKPTASSPLASGNITNTGTASGVPNGSANFGTLTEVAAAATKLAFTAVSNNATAGAPFSVTVQSQDSGGNPASPSSDTTITLSKASGSGTLSGILTGTILTSGSSVTISTPVYSIPGTLTLTASATAGQTSLSPATSGSIAVSSINGCTVTINSPASAKYDDYFDSTVDITSAVNFDSADYIVSFNPGILALVGVSGGTLNGTAVPVDSFSPVPGQSGQYRILQNISGTSGISGSGNLARLHLNIIATGTTASINFMSSTIFDNSASPIPAVWNGSSINISGIISFNSNGGSAVDPIIQDYGSAVSAPPAPTKANYIFTGWYSDAGLSNAYTFTTMPTVNITLYAKWTANTPNTFKVTATAGSHGTISPSGQVTVNSGANQTFTITPDANYHVTSVLVDDISVGAVASYTFTNVTTNHTIAANFSINKFTLTVSSSANGRVFGADSGGYLPSGSLSGAYSGLPAGDVITFSATPNTGYLFGGWSSNVINNQLTITADTTVAVIFITAPVNPSTYTLTMAASPLNGGTATDNTSGSPYLAGTFITITAVPAAGYYFVNWTVSAGTITNANLTTTTFNMPAAVATITANFALGQTPTPTTTPTTPAPPPGGGGGGGGGGRRWRRQRRREHRQRDSSSFKWTERQHSEFECSGSYYYQRSIDIIR